MIKEPTIIDGVDVSGCKNFSCGLCEEENKIPRTINHFTADCRMYPNCYYKQYKRKEQDYEELRQYHNKCCEENAKKETEWLEKFNQISTGFYKGDYCNTEHCNLLKVKQQECEELKNAYTRLNSLYNDNCNFTSKLEQTLTEIKEVLQFYNNTTIGVDKGNGIFELEVSNDNVGKLIYCYDTNPARQSLQKISEVEND